MGKRRREFKRTCQRCETVWYASIERKPNRMQIAGVKMQGAGGRMSLFGGRKAAASEVAASRLEGKRDSIEALERCPGCGSQSYGEETVEV